MSHPLTRACFFLFLLVAPAVTAWAWGSDVQFPPPAPVVDQFGLLSQDESARLASILQQIKSRSGVEISVFIPASLQDRVIEDFSIAVAEQWKLGRKKEDKALLFVIAPKERKMRLEVGYGLEGEVTDAFSRRVLDDIMRPSFRAGRYLEGILATLVALQQKTNLGLGETETREYSSSARGGGAGSVLETFFIIAIILLFIVFSLISRVFGFGRRHSGWYGGGGGGWSSGGGSSWGGGGGGFGGGGASSSW